MDDVIKRSWERIREAILGKWGDRVDEDDLETPLTYSELCTFFGERCELQRRQAEEEVRRLLNQAGSRPTGV